MDLTTKDHIASGQCWVDLYIVVNGVICQCFGTVYTLDEYNSDRMSPCGDGKAIDFPMVKKTEGMVDIVLNVCSLTEDNINAALKGVCNARLVPNPNGYGSITNVPSCAIAHRLDLDLS